jgi:hydroxyacylglutathione hydrolase
MYTLARQEEYMSNRIVAIDLGFVNAYLLPAAGGRFVLVDTGLSSQWARLTGALTAAGCGPGSLALVVISHADTDHTGNARRLQAEWGSPLAAHPADAASLETGESPPRQGRGPLARVIMGLMGLARALGGGRMESPTFKPDVLLEEGQELSAWGLEARVLHLPGHTRGSIALLTAAGELVSGDVFANRSRPDVSPFIESFEAYRGSLARVKALVSSITTVYPGHGPSFPGAAIAGIEV